MWIPLWYILFFASPGEAKAIQPPITNGLNGTTYFHTLGRAYTHTSKIHLTTKYDLVSRFHLAKKVLDLYYKNFQKPTHHYLNAIRYLVEIPIYVYVHILICCMSITATL